MKRAIEKFGWNDIWHDEEKIIYSKTISLNSNLIVFHRRNNEIKIRQIEPMSGYSLEELQAIYETALEIKREK